MFLLEPYASEPALFYGERKLGFFTAMNEPSSYELASERFFPKFKIGLRVLPVV